MNGVMCSADPVGALGSGECGETQLRRWLFEEIESWRDAWICPTEWLPGIGPYRGLTSTVPVCYSK